MWCPNPLLLAGEQLGSSPQDRAFLQPLGLQVGPGELCGPQKAVGREHGRAGLERASVALKEPVWLRGALVLGLAVSLISQPDRNGNEQEVSVIPGGRDVSQRHTGCFAEGAGAAMLGTTSSQ